MEARRAGHDDRSTFASADRRRVVARSWDAADYVANASLFGGVKGGP